MNELDPGLYRVAWIAPLEIEARAALLLLDHQHKGRFPVSRGDDYVFRAGDVCGHNIIIATIPAGQEYGTGSAAALAGQVKKFFPNLWFGLLVGVAAGLPNLSRDPPLDIRLGDVLVGLPEGESAGLIAYDLGKETSTNGLQLLRGGHVLANTEKIVRSAISSIKLQAPDDAEVILEHYKNIRDKRHTNGTFIDPGQENDILFWMDESGMSHTVDRQRRPDSDRTRVWYGAIGSGEKLMKNAQKRNELRDKHNIIGLEMEAAGIMNHIPVGVIRGVCDYGDEHKNKEWQPYAAAMAASYAKAILAEILPSSAVGNNEAPLQNNNRSKRRLSEQSLCLREGRPKRRYYDNIESPRDQPLPNSSQVVPQSMNEEQKRVLLESLRFDQIDARHDTIKSAHRKTCQWLLNKSEYLDWLNPRKFTEHYGFLWIKGKPGAGKSTLMKYIVNHAQKKKPKYNIISFFLNARGEDLEKSTIGMYRSLLLQLLEQLPHLQSVFESLGSTTRNSAYPQWSVEPLKRLFEQAILGLGTTLKLMCFIDALDECEERQIRDMVSFFESVGRLAVSHDITFNVCFSSRHYPYITISKGLSLTLEGQEGHEQDIISYLDSELKIGQSKAAEQIRLNLKEKASGVFMWVVLVVRILRREYDHGRMNALRKRLKEIPADLHRLFREILTRDDQYRSGLILVIQWVLFMKTPLRPNQLYIAILCGLNPNTTSTWNCNEIQENDIRRYILSCSKGLVEITRSKTKPTVQFIHESVRDFLLKENGLDEIWSDDDDGNFQGVSHDRLKQCCLGYLSMSIADVDTSVLLDEKPSRRAIAVARDFAANKFPLLEYATKNVLYHAETAEASGVSQVNFIRIFQLTDWIRLANLFEKHAIRRHKLEASLLYILAELNAWNLIKCHPDKLTGIKVEEDRYGPPILAAVATGSHEAACELLKAHVETQPLASPLHGLYEQYRDDQHEPTSIGRVSDDQYQNVLWYLRDAPNELIMTLFLSSEPYSVDIVGNKYYAPQSLKHAASSGYGIATRLLLENNVLVDEAYESIQGPLSLAVENGYLNIVQLLLNYGASATGTGRNGRALLSLAAEGGHLAIAHLLVNHGASVTKVDFLGQTPLLWAIRGAEHRAKSLFDCRATDNDTAVVLSNSTTDPFSESIPIIQFLLDQGTCIDAADNSGRTLLSWAVSQCYDTKGVIPQLLLDRGANIEATDENGRTALSWAGYFVNRFMPLRFDPNTYFEGWMSRIVSIYPNSGVMIRLLLRNGGNIEATDKNGRTLLWWASLGSSHRAYEVVELLLDNGANAEAADRYGRTPLSQIASNGNFNLNKNTILLLLSHGANLKAIDKNRLTPLDYFEKEGNEKAVIKLIQERGKREIRRLL